MLSSFQCRFFIRNIVVDESAGDSMDVAFSLEHDDSCQGLQSLLPGNLCLGSTLGLKGQIDVF